MKIFLKIKRARNIRLSSSLKLQRIIKPEPVLKVLFSKSYKWNSSFNHTVILLKTGDLKSTQNWIWFFFSKKFKNCVYFFTCILPDYMAHNISKEFLEDSHFENTTAGFLLRCQNLLRLIPPKMMHFQTRKKMILTNNAN